MDRRLFLRGSTFGLASLAIAPPLIAEDQAAPSLSDRPLRRFAFGSCNFSDLDQSFWSRIQANDPELWIWLGDNIYADGLTMYLRKLKYQNLKNERHYAAFRAKVPIIGTWDDHDFAKNNSDGSFSGKAESKVLVSSFLDIRQGADFAQRPGIYQSYTYGPKGYRTKVLLLDLRYNQDRSRSEMLLLGEEQWQWLSNEVATDDFQLLIIGSSLNLTTPHRDIELEGWEHFGYERQRLYNLLASVDAQILVLSGDRHQAEMSRFELDNGRIIYEFMSSGLTHALGNIKPSPYSMSKVIRSRNFGLVDIDWTDPRPKLFMQIKSPASNKILAMEHGV